MTARGRDLRRPPWYGRGQRPELPDRLDGRLAALAGGERCYFLTDDLTHEQFEAVAGTCLCSREVRAGRLEGPFTTDLAQRWARVFLTLDT